MAEPFVECNSILQYRIIRFICVIILSAFLTAVLILAGCDQSVSSGKHPDTTIISFPGETTGPDSVLFRWTGTDPDGTVSFFRWSLDDSAWVENYTNEIVFYGLSDGAHWFKVKAVDDDQMEDPIPARVDFFVIYNVPPQTTITIGPASEINVTNAYFEWIGTDEDGEVIGYEIKLDEENWTLVDTTFIMMENLSTGEHLFLVRAIDEENLVDPSPDSLSFNINNDAVLFSQLTELSFGQERTEYVFYIMNKGQINTLSWAMIPSIDLLRIFSEPDTDGDGQPGEDFAELSQGTIPPGGKTFIKVTIDRDRMSPGDHRWWINVTATNIDNLGSDGRILVSAQIPGPIQFLEWTILSSIDPTSDSGGSDNSYIEAGEVANLKFSLINIGNISTMSTSATVSTGDSSAVLRIENASQDFDNISAGGIVTSSEIEPVTLHMSYDVRDGSTIPLIVLVQDSWGYTWELETVIKVYSVGPVQVYQVYVDDDSLGSSNSNGDRKLNADDRGRHIEMPVTLHNAGGHDLKNVNVTISSTNTNIIFTSKQVSYGDFIGGASGTPGDDFEFDVSDSYAGYPVTFTLTITAEVYFTGEGDGTAYNYTWTASFQADN